MFPFASVNVTEDPYIVSGVLFGCETVTVDPDGQKEVVVADVTCFVAGLVPVVTILTEMVPGGTLIVCEKAKLGAIAARYRIAAIAVMRAARIYNTCSERTWD